MTYDTYKFSCLLQGSDDWHKARMGYFSGSQVGQLMKIGKRDADKFSDTAMSYIYDVAAKRRILPAFLEGEGWADYRLRNEVRSRQMQWGNDFEPVARTEYERRNNIEVHTCGFILHPEIEWFGDSPDGIIIYGENIPIGALEIKCPDSKTFIRYEYELNKLEYNLKDVNWDYYWQCLCHMAVNDVQYTDFVCYDPMVKDGYLQHRIYRDDVKVDIELMEQRVRIANQTIEHINGTSNRSL